MCGPIGLDFFPREHRQGKTILIVPVILERIAIPLSEQRYQVRFQRTGGYAMTKSQEQTPFTDQVNQKMPQAEPVFIAVEKTAMKKKVAPLCALRALESAKCGRARDKNNPWISIYFLHKS
jgi:hypothetical protein